MKKELISLVIPCYNEEDTVNIFYEEIKKQIKKMDYVDFEIIFVNDGSKDKTLDMIRNLVQKDEMVRYLSFSRNFGKEAAMLAGFEASYGDYVTTMDVDLQDPPYLLEEMYKAIKDEGYDCAATKSTSRNGYGFFRKIFTKWFYKIIGRMSDIEMVAGARDYRLMTRQMVEAILDMKEYNRYSKGIFSFIGFDTKWIEYENQERSVGKTKWNFWKLFSYAIDGIVGFSTKPLLFASFLGILFCLIAFILIIFIIIRTLIWGDPVSGWPSMACIVFLVGGINLFCTGIIGKYLAQTYLETKKRPIYIIKETEKSMRR